MKTVGKQLSEARTGKGWSPEMAARETKIRLDRLRELEEDDYSNFSSPTYARGFVRTYARALGIDEYRILRQLDNKLPEDDNASFANDTGVPYMPEPSQVSKPFQVGRGAYIAGGVGFVVLLFIGFILVQAYRADYFTASTPAPSALPVTETNAMPVVPDTQTARALPADSNAAPIPLPVDAATLAANPPEAAPAPTPAAGSAVDTNGPLRAQPVDLNGLATAPVATPSATLAAIPMNTNAAAPGTAPASAEAIAPAPTVPTNISTPPRAQAVDLNAVDAADVTNAPSAPMAEVAPTPAAEPTQRPNPHGLSARESNSHPAATRAAADKATQDLITSTAPISTSASTPEISVGQAAASPVVLPSTTAPAVASADPSPAASVTPSASPADTTSAPSSLEPVSGNPSSTSSETTGTADKPRSKRLVLTAAHDSFVRVISLDGSGSGQVRYSSMLKSGESISFNDHKYSINVGDPSAVDIALDGINYGPHSENSSPDTFTVESHTP